MGETDPAPAAVEKNTSDPEHPQSYGNLGLCHANLGFRAKALDCLNKALEIDPSYQPARTNKIAVEHMKEGEPLKHVRRVTTEYYREVAERERRPDVSRERRGLSRFIP